MSQAALTGGLNQSTRLMALRCSRLCPRPQLGTREVGVGNQGTLAGSQRALASVPPVTGCELRADLELNLEWR